MKKETLISKNEFLASEHIAMLEKKGVQASEAIKVFNNIELLESIATGEMALAFLANSVKYLNGRILKDIPHPPKAGSLLEYDKVIEKVFASWLRRLDDAGLDEGHLAKIERLFADYGEIVGEISAFQLRDLDDLVFDEDTLLIEFDETCRAKIEESFFEYARSRQESGLVIKTRRIAKDLNELVELFHLESRNFSAVCSELGFLEIRAKAPGYKFYEDIEAIRNYMAIIDNS